MIIAIDPRIVTIKGKDDPIVLMRIDEGDVKRPGRAESCGEAS